VESAVFVLLFKTAFLDIKVSSIVQEGGTMTERALKNTWVEIGGIVLQKDQSAPNLPDDTKQVPLEMRVKGFLLHDAEKGAEAEIVTPAGRRVRGTITAINPVYTHMFGRPIPELSTIAGEIRALLRERRNAS
jgi:hypothetical protein